MTIKFGFRYKMTDGLMKLIEVYKLDGIDLYNPHVLSHDFYFSGLLIRGEAKF